MALKKIVFRRTEIKTPPLSTSARVEIGQLLKRLQAGESLSLPHSRPMPTIGSRVHELRVNDENQTWRLFYRIDSDAIILVELLSKKTKATPLSTARLCKKRLRDYDDEVAQRKL